MRRRDFIKVVAGSVAAWPLGTRAQPDDRKRRIGYLSPVAESDPENQNWVREFTQRLHELGWTGGRNVRIDFRFGNAVDPMRISMLATELVEDHPDVIIASGLAAAVALRQQTLHTDRFCASCRSGLSRFRHKLGAAGGQHHRLHQF
jgi:putative tryptophan/tyrosine transport system substrate-binding protein